MYLPSDALLQHLPSYLGFSYLGHGVSLHSCSSKAQPLLLILDEGYLLTTTPPDLEHGTYFPGGSDGKASAYSAGDPGSIPGSGRSPREVNGNPLQYSCLENPMNSMKRQNDRILKWFAIPFSSGPHSVRPLHHDPPVLGGPTGMA